MIYIKNNNIALSQQINYKNTLHNVMYNALCTIRYTCLVNNVIYNTLHMS